MSTHSMDVFALRDAVVDEYKKFATSFTTIAADDIRAQVEAIYANERYWPEPLIQINPNYKAGPTAEQLASSGGLDPRCADIFRTGRSETDPRGTSLKLHKHQEQAIAFASQGDSYIVTTGTGSGKSLCFFIPVVSAILAEKRRDSTKRTRAIIIYPMNALANSQAEEIAKFLENVPGEKPITFARYTGQEESEERQRVADDPPDILLTNFMMLELLMTRQEEIDRKVIGNCVGLRFLVLDELHTYRGRQGADVALLVRRVREQLAPERLQCIGTSATMASEGSIEDKNKVVAGVASRLFAQPIHANNIVGETLERVTDPDLNAAKIRKGLGAAIDAGIPANTTDAALRVNALAAWVETNLGIRFSDVDQRWVRAHPKTVTEAVDALSAESSRPTERCRAVLRDLLLVSSAPEFERLGRKNGSGRSFFAFKLHQFISGAGHAYSTLESPGRRTVTVEGQQFLPGAPDKRLYPVHFCRECGHEFHPVRLVTEEGTQTFHARSIDDGPITRPDDEETPGADTEENEDGELFGFLTVHPTNDPEFDFDDRDDDYPENWVDDVGGKPRLKSHYRKARARGVSVTPDGKVGAGIKAWFLPGRFRFCPACGDTQGGSARDRNRLASLSAEGRSSATTVLVGSALRWMHGRDSGLEATKRKLLGFTDNRQDAALQAGHFNDFLFVSLIRSGFYGALLLSPEGLRSQDLGVAQQKSLGFDRAATRSEWLLEPDLRGFNLQDAEATLRQVLTYRVWFDQRRGWRYTNPNLEQLDLVEVEYLGLEDLAADDALFAKAPDVLRNASANTRARAFRAVLDHMRKSMAIRSHVLDPTVIDQLVAKSHSRLRAPWGFGTEEKPARARWLMVTSPKTRDSRDQDLIARGGSRSALGKELRKSDTWGTASIRDLKSKEIDALVVAMLAAATKHGLVSEESTPFRDTPGWRLNDECVRFKIRTTSSNARGVTENKFFRSFYANLANMLREPSHPLFGFEAREHTAQVDKEKREVREQRFRFGTKEQEELAGEAKHLGEIGESARFLPVLFCSPTMELGVDISALNAVYLRNVPPTPANYAQRSGRAGRSGQAALVLTYCSSQGPHDQYFFRAPKQMVHGEVRPPMLDLANRELVESHLHATWLACTKQPLSGSIAEILSLNDPQRPLRADVRAPMSEPRVADEALRRIKRLLDTLAPDLTPQAAPWYQVGRDEFADTVVRGAIGEFDKAFRRWRELFRAAEQQRDSARRMMDDYSAPQAEKHAAKSRHAQAIDQLELLQKEKSTQSSDFYTYRYLATEGFLPGYNFPRLPLMAYVPATNDGRGRQTYLQRPRFLALAEFGPRSLVYHEGRAFRVVRALLSLSHRDNASADTRLPTQAVRICKACGGGHFNDDASNCHACGRSLGDAEIIKETYRIENVATQPAERITANDEERQRQGFELQTTFEWAVRDGAVDARTGAAADGSGPIVKLSYGSGATITRLNKGLRRRAEKKTLGFRINPISGYWAKNEDEPEDRPDPTQAPPQWIVPCVRDQKNALLLQLADPSLEANTIATLQHALLRGIEAHFQLEQGEVLAEPMPNADERTGCLFYEATEGGAGVLTRLVSEPGALAAVTLRALQIMHFEVDATTIAALDPAALEDVDGTSCVAACYRCLMSYYNQTDHERIDRRDEAVRSLLVRLARSMTTLDAPSRPASIRPPVDPSDAIDPDDGARGEPSRTAPGNSPSGDWYTMARVRRIPAHDPSPLVVDGTSVQWVWRSHYVIAALGDLAAATRATLEGRGFVIVTFADESTWPTAFDRLAKELGHSG